MERERIRWNGWGLSGQEHVLGETAWRWLARSLAMPALLATPPRELSSIALPPPRLSEQAREKLTALLGASGLRQDDFERARHAAGRGLTDLLRLRAGNLATAPDAVLYPRNAADVLAVLHLCAQLGVAVIPFGGGTGDTTPMRGDHAAVVALNLSAMNHVASLDAMSGLAQAEAGITGPELERQLAARGMMLGYRPGDFEFSTLGGWIAGAQTGQDWLHSLRAATPQGMLAGEAPAGPDLKQVMPGSRGAFGVITSATLRVRAVPEKEEYRGYLFPDFAAGLAAIRQAQRIGLPHSLMRLSDDGETRFSRALARTGWNLGDYIFDIYLSIRRFDSHAAQLLAGFSGTDRQVTAARKRFDALAKKLGALPLGVDTKWQKQRFEAGYRREALLDRGVGMDEMEISASWSKLPALYVAVQAALKRAMRTHVPRAGAHGLVLAHVAPAQADGATLTVSWVFPRTLENDIAQAEAIRRAALDALAPARNETLDLEVLRGIKRTLDPKGILSPGKLAL